MEIDALKSHYDAEPFLPIELILDDGGRVAVVRRSAMAFLPSGRGVAVFDADERSHHLAKERIVGVRFAPPGSLAP